jgi:hypothetical protein
MILSDESISLVRLFTHAAERRTDEHDAPLVDRFCRLTPRASAPFSVALYAGPGKS